MGSENIEEENEDSASECPDCGVEGGHAHLCPSGSYGDEIDLCVDEGRLP